MKNIILFDNEVREQLLPLTFTRPVGEIRVGILTIQEKWKKLLNGQVSHITQDYLSKKFPARVKKDNYVIDGTVIPTFELARLVAQLDMNEALMDGDDFIAARVSETQLASMINSEAFDALKGTDIGTTPFLKIRNTWDIFKFNKTALLLDFLTLTKGRKSAPISPTNTIIGENLVFLEAGAKVECSSLNATDGPIYIGENAVVMEGCMIRGGFALGDNATLKMGTKIYGPTTIGPYSKFGGEVKNSVVFGYSNKAHDGYLGNSVIGEWCNLGANTNNSNMKNNYSDVKVWNYEVANFISSGEQFCGCVLGDHTKTGISTMLNTGTIVGVFANIFGTGFPKKFVPSFSWGGTSETVTYRLDKAFEVAEKVYKRRNIRFDEVEKTIFKTIFEQTAENRQWENKVEQYVEKQAIPFSKS